MTDKTQAALKLALEALKRMKKYGDVFLYRSHEQKPYDQVCEAITAIEALADHFPDATKMMEPAQQQEPVKYSGNGTAGFSDAKAEGFFFQIPKAQQQEPGAGKGKEYSEQLKLCARNVAFAASGHVDMSLAAMQEMFALIDHVCVGLDSPPANTNAGKSRSDEEQPAQQQEPVVWPHKWGCRANAFGECNMGCTSPQPAQQQEPNK